MEVLDSPCHGNCCARVRVSSTPAAKDLVMTYGTTVNQNILSRMDKLNMPKVVGFITPLLVKEHNTVVIEQEDNFFEQQLELFKYN